MATSQKHSLRHRWLRAIRRRKGTANDLGQTGIIAVVAFSVLASLVGAVIVQTVVTSNPLFQAKAVEIYAHRALEAGQNAYLTAVNANPSLAQCNTNTNGAGTCSGIDYGKWNVVNGSNSSGSDLEYYSFGNPQPTFDPNTNALTGLAVQVVGAAYDPSAENNYLFDQETINVTPSNGFLENVWWSNYESYSGNGNYSTCNYNWKLGYNISGAGVSCGPVYFGPERLPVRPGVHQRLGLREPVPGLRHQYRPVPGDDSRPQLPVRRQRHQQGDEREPQQLFRSERPTSRCTTPSTAPTTTPSSSPRPTTPSSAPSPARTGASTPVPRRSTCPPMPVGTGR